MWIKEVQIAGTLTKENDYSCFDAMLDFFAPCVHAESQWQGDLWKLCSASLTFVVILNKNQKSYLSSSIIHKWMLKNRFMPVSGFQECRS